MLNVFINLACQQVKWILLWVLSWLRYWIVWHLYSYAFSKYLLSRKVKETLFQYCIFIVDELHFICHKCLKAVTVIRQMVGWGCALCSSGCHDSAVWYYNVYRLQMMPYEAGHDGSDSLWYLHPVNNLPLVYALCSLLSSHAYCLKYVLDCKIQTW